MIFRIRMWLVMRVLEIYGLQHFFTLPRWFQFLCAAADPTTGLRQSWCRHYGYPRYYICGFDMAATEQTFAKEHGMWYCYTTPRPDCARVVTWLNDQMVHSCGIPKRLFNPRP